MSKNSFVLYVDYYAHIDRLSIEQRGVLLTAIFAHVNGSKEPEMDAATGMAFSFIAMQLDRDSEKWGRTCQARSNAGQKGGIASGESRKQAKQLLNLIEPKKQNKANTKELTDSLRKSRTIDWQQKESARAGMRRMVKRLLKKHKYPPEGMEDAIATVIGQCEMWTDNI